MSIKTRREIAYWFLLLLGMTLNAFQTYKYLTNQLEYSTLELIVLIVGLAFNFAPKYLLNLFEKVVIKKIEKQ